MPTERTAMKKYLLLVLSVATAAACVSQQQAPAPAQPEYMPTATVREIMNSIIDPSADAVWGAVETTVSAEGIQEKYPRTDEEWLAVRRQAITLLEASNLLKIPGRAIAKPGETSEFPEVELVPEKVKELVDKDPVSWGKYAQALHDATADVLKTIDAKDPEAFLNMGDGIYQACEMCHMQYWYPDDKVPSPPDVKGGS
jgi:hypothetical protein